MGYKGWKKVCEVKQKVFKGEELMLTKAQNVKEKVNHTQHDLLGGRGRTENHSSLWFKWRGYFTSLSRNTYWASQKW